MITTALAYALGAITLTSVLEYQRHHSQHEASSLLDSAIMGAAWPLMLAGGIGMYIAVRFFGWMGADDE